jgi:16S rRNA C967 or C1407 C5-methylase (RsmB/RsmF family)
MFPEGFIELLQASTGRADVVAAALEQAPSVSIRLNPAKLQECPFPEAERVPWSPYGYLLKERPVFTLDPLFHAGCYYVQDTSAMFVGHVFRQVTEDLQPGCRVLDLCAAPGGKTTDLAASLRERFGDRYSLLANEVMRNRYAVLRSNVETWGDPRVGTVSRDPSAFGEDPVFDAIVADVPCSGEGMFRKDQQAIDEWSPKTVEFCAARSRRILSDIWPTLQPGGILIYSTCTFNHFENDDTVEWIAKELGADVIPLPPFPPAVNTKYGYALLPGLVPGEGQYVAALKKHSDCPSKGIAGRPKDAFPGASALFFAPGNALSASGDKSGGPIVNVDRLTALHYLHGDAIVLPEDAPLGEVTIAYEGHALGPGKNLGKRCNNLYPKNKRIRMDIR